MRKTANFLGRKSLDFIVQHKTRSIVFLDIGHHGDCLQWEINIYLRYLFCLLFCNVYFIHMQDGTKRSTMLSTDLIATDNGHGQRNLARGDHIPVIRGKRLQHWIRHCWVPIGCL